VRSGWEAAALIEHLGDEGRRHAPELGGVGNDRRAPALVLAAGAAGDGDAMAWRGLLN
jgi:hypothetical protein